MMKTLSNKEVILTLLTGLWTCTSTAGLGSDSKSLEKREERGQK